MDQFEIAICGGGVGGLACALALIKAGHKVTVFERAEQFLRIGADDGHEVQELRVIDFAAQQTSQVGDRLLAFADDLALALRLLGQGEGRRREDGAE